MPARMRAWHIAGLVTAIVVASFAPAAAQGPDDPVCKPQSVLVDAADYQWVDDYCGILPVKGTLNGTYLTCVVPDPTSPWGVSFFPPGSDEDDYYAYFEEWIETPQGTLQLHSITAGFWESGLQSGLSKVVPEGSTGAFTGATGYFSLVPEWQTFDPVNLTFATKVRLTGYVCTR